MTKGPENLGVVQVLAADRPLESYEGYGTRKVQVSTYVRKVARS